MATLTFPVQPDGLEVDVLVNIKACALLPLRQAGQPSPSPIAARGLLDTASDISGVSLTILRQLGLSFVVQGTTTGIGGTVPVNIYEVSLHILDARAPGLPWFAQPLLPVMGLDPAFPHPVLIGMDVLLQCKTTLDGPGRVFSLDF